MSAVTGFAHVGILVEDLAPVARLFGERLGVEVTGPTPEPELGLEVLWVRVGATTLEFISPTDPTSRAAQAIARGEGGVHHVALQVEGLEALLSELDAAGVPIRDRTPRQGAHGTRVSFLDPAASGGALVELIEG
jgi:methylmalonyl-CoA/ethylmalonyl-CoA epimerase